MLAGGEEALGAVTSPASVDAARATIEAAVLAAARGPLGDFERELDATAALAGAQPSRATGEGAPGAAGAAPPNTSAGTAARVGGADEDEEIDEADVGGGAYQQLRERLL